jgi:hypothetical protein
MYFCDGYFWDRVLRTVCLLALNHSSPDLCLMSS